MSQHNFIKKCKITCYHNADIISEMNSPSQVTVITYPSRIDFESFYKVCSINQNYTFQLFILFIKCNEIVLVYGFSLMQP